MNLIVVAGPTAVGKTEVSVDLAIRLGTEVISADSRQIFREMSIGTAKPGHIELRGIRYHLIGSHSIAEDYNAATYAMEARSLIDKLFATYDDLVLCGGSGLYIKAVCEGLDDIPNIPSEIRQSLNESYAAYGIGWLQEKIQQVDPDYYAGIDRHNPQRIIRALEVKMGTGRSLGSFHGKSKVARRFSVVKIGLEIEREALYRRIDERVDGMIEAGLVHEAERLYPDRDNYALQTVGYKEIFNYLEGKLRLEEAIHQIKQHSRQYAKRQLTWFKNDPEFVWYRPDEVDRIYEFIVRNKEQPTSGTGKA